MCSSSARGGRPAREHGLELVDPGYFSTEARREQLLRVQRETPGRPCWTTTARPW